MNYFFKAKKKSRAEFFLPLMAFSVFRYGWRATEWTECRVDPLLSQQDKRRGNQTALCGGGVQTREVYCVQTNENLSHLKTHKDKEGKLCFLLKDHAWRPSMGCCRNIYPAFWGMHSHISVHIMVAVHYGEQ